MAEPCKQEEIIGELKAIARHVENFMERHETREEKTLELMEIIGSQTEIMKSHGQTLDRHENAINQLFVLARKEKSLAVRIMESPAGLWMLIAIALGFVIDCYRNFNIVKIVIQFLK